ncbi:hypothetical protein ACJJTC_001194 [Scirpophaga incertulas]
MPLLTEFSPREIADIHFYYGMCRGVARAARIAYIAAFPNRMQPSARNFQEVHRRFSNVGLGLAREHRQQADVIDTSIEEAVLNDVFADPTISTRRLAARHEKLPQRLNKKEVARALGTARLQAHQLKSRI